MSAIIVRSCASFLAIFVTCFLYLKLENGLKKHVQTSLQNDIWISGYGYGNDICTR